MLLTTQGATLQNYNTELVKYLEEIRGKREDINNDIMREEGERSKIESELNMLKERLLKVNSTRSPLTLSTDSLKKKYEARNEFDKTLKETESAFVKVSSGVYFLILESSQTLLHVLKREGANLSKKKESLDPAEQQE